MLAHKYHRKGRTKTEGGFTLLETCIALVILMFMGLTAASLFAYAVTNNGGAGDRAMALAVAQEQLEQLRNTPFNSIESTITATGGSPKTYTSGGRSFLVTTAVTQTPAAPAAATFKTITVSVAPTGGKAVWANNPVTVVVHRSTLDTGAYLR
ncbi:MAG TPA: hypothetical protein VF507_02690 [Pyrinomonadaceae bacterium]